MGTRCSRNIDGNKYVSLFAQHGKHCSGPKNVSEKYFFFLYWMVMMIIVVISVIIIIIIVDILQN